MVTVVDAANLIPSSNITINFKNAIIESLEDDERTLVDLLVNRAPITNE